jgi:dipeptidyl aminopeptidase/acylaminoacyl peptidase
VKPDSLPQCGWSATEVSLFDRPPAEHEPLFPGSLIRRLALLPRWSPDGKRIAFVAKRPDAPFRIFVTATTGGPLLEASHGTDNQGAPTWSPDGRRLVYGRVFCQEEKTCAIQEISLDTAEQTMVPGSEGLSTARWSPDGRYIGALRSDMHEVCLLDRRTGQWRKLAEGVNGNDLAWSPDSRHLYASKPNGDRPEVIRISPGTGGIEPAVDLTDFSKLSGRIDTWFAVTPDDSILFVHIVSGQEVFGLRYNR